MPRNSPSGPFEGIARLSISAPVAFTTAVAKVIPFDQVDLIQGDIGDLEGTGTLAVSAGLYLVQSQLEVSVAQTTIELDLGCNSLSVGDNASLLTPGGVKRINGTLNALRAATETPISASVFARIGAQITATGTSGTIVSASMLVYKLVSPTP